MWKIFYSDGTHISSEDMSPFSIPYKWHEGVQVIIQPDSEHRWKTVCGHDYYMWDYREPELGWWGGDRDGLSYYLRTPGHKCVLFGTFISKQKYREIFNLARSEFGEKTGFDPTERVP